MQDWGRQKEYMERRANVLAAKMEKCIEDGNREEFLQAYTTAMNYMRKPRRVAFYKRMLAKEIEMRHGK